MTSLRIHGGPDAHGVPLHDFSTNSNACGPCPVALLAINKAQRSKGEAGEKLERGRAGFI